MDALARQWAEAVEQGMEDLVHWPELKAPERAMDKIIQSYGGDVPRILDICRQVSLFAPLPRSLSRSLAPLLSRSLLLSLSLFCSLSLALSLARSLARARACLLDACVHENGCRSRVLRAPTPTLCRRDKDQSRRRHNQNAKDPHHDNDNHRHTYERQRQTH
eukprot:811164-Rhodomonas_salina.1